MNVRSINILLFFVNVITSQNFNYQEGDWFILQKADAVNAIAETPYIVLFGTNNGIYTQDKFTEAIEYSYDLSKELSSNKIYHIIYNQYTDFYWVVHENGISFKSSISRYWREISFFSLNLSNYTDIDRIGYTRDAIWIKYGYQNIPLDPFNGSVIDLESSSLENFIFWGSNRYSNSSNNLDLSKYTFPRGWSINYNIINDQNNNQIIPTVIYENKFGTSWIGTENGMLLYGKSYWLKPYSLGITNSNITEIYFDNKKQWWFSDSRYKRSEMYTSNTSKFLEKGIPFIIQWDEFSNQWDYFYSNESVSISNTDINCIQRVGDTMYFGTMNGLLTLNLIDRSWGHIRQGLKDKAVWDIKVYKNSLYIATARGISEVSVLKPVIIPDIYDWFSLLNNKEVYQLEVKDSLLYVAFEAGLATISLITGEIKYLSDRNIRKFKIDNEKIVVLDGQIWEINLNQKDKKIYSEGMDFTLSGDFVWIVEKRNIILINTVTEDKWIYNQDDGIPGNIIYTLDCDEDWVWFGTNQGVAYYKWSNYHYE